MAATRRRHALPISSGAPALAYAAETKRARHIESRSNRCVHFRTRFMSQFFGFAVQSIDGSPDLLSPLQGRVVLAVNVASRCGYTPQYAGLEDLHRQLSEQGFTVIGFPCNQFGGQEPGTEREIMR